MSKGRSSLVSWGLGANNSSNSFDGKCLYSTDTHRLENSVTILRVVTLPAQPRIQQ